MTALRRSSRIPNPALQLKETPLAKKRGGRKGSTKGGGNHERENEVHESGKRVGRSPFRGERKESRRGKKILAMQKGLIRIRQRLKPKNKKRTVGNSLNEIRGGDRSPLRGRRGD